MPWMPLGWVGASGGVSAGTFELISTTLISTNTPSVTFNLSAANQAAYKHLQLRMAVPSGASPASNGTYIRLQFNGDTGSNYSRHELWGQGSSALSNNASTQTAIAVSGSAGTNASNIADAHILDLLDPFNTNKNKTIRNFVGAANASGGSISLVSGAWFSTSAVSSIVLAAYSQGSASTFGSGARFSLYGVR